jgi:hypothetical protein
MYKFSEPEPRQIELFEKTFLFESRLNRKNRWIVLSNLINWREFEYIYAQTFSLIGRPGVRARYVIGSLILKHKLGVSDEELTLQIAENPYMQYFIGLDNFQDQTPYDPSTLTNVRKRLSDEQFTKFEESLVKILLEQKLIKPKGLQTDATVFESEITYPTDCGLLNKARQFCVKHIKELSQQTGDQVRTYCRVAQKAYLSFSKKRRKTQKEVRRMQKALLQYLRRNVKQLSEFIEKSEAAGEAVSEKMFEMLETAKQIYSQQKQMYDEKKKSIPNRIVSLHKSYVRPIVRGKNGKNVEFGAKTSLSHVDGYMFLDYHSFENYNEGPKLQDSVEKFQKRFGKLPDYVSMDQIYGSQKNRKYLKEHNIRASVKPLGRPKKNKSDDAEERWRRKKQKERNRIEGAIGNSKTGYDLGLVRAKTEKTEISWINMALLSRNLAIAGKRI